MKLHTQCYMKWVMKIGIMKDMLMHYPKQIYGFLEDNNIYKLYDKLTN